MSPAATASAGPEEGGAGTPFKPYEAALEQEIREAEHELGRPAMGLFLSGLLAGFGLGLGIALAAALLPPAGATPPGPGLEVLLAAAYASGFVLVIMGRTGLFTEYTTMAILPVLAGRATVAELARLWGLVYSANLIGAAAFAALAVALTPQHGPADAAAFARLARGVVDGPASVMLLSDVLAGWLMGLLSWLLSAARDSVSQIVPRLFLRSTTSYVRVSRAKQPALL